LILESILINTTILSTIRVKGRRRRKVRALFKRNMSEAPRRVKGGLVSHILLHEGDVPGARLTVTWVDVAPGSGQRPHEHAPEQVYVVVRGRGRMRVGDDERAVDEGDVIFIPPGVVHGIENASKGVLTYVSAATPALDWRTFYDGGPLRPRT
jgi:mannose-6-phosphate isomerase-like protein (cupin superfamily)